ncbi:MAG: DUF1259 domain-containing protein [Acidobacteria bacterium]|nr:MAG: DUF1259 domain-containing protein [Acidobacteriota bacterium]
MNASAIAGALGRSGQRSGSVYKVGFPRTDLHVQLQGVTLRPGLALGSWAAFTPSRQSTLIMGDLCLLPQEVNPVMRRLRAGGYQITALHNHLLFEQPHVMFMHFMAQGDAVSLARTLRAALAQSATPLQPLAPAKPSSPPAWVSVVEGGLGRKGSWRGGVLAIGVPRKVAPRMEGAALPPSMGVAESMNFQEAGGGRVATTGDFVLTADEVNPVISALEQYQFTITAVHSHMLTEQPRLFYMHFWKVGSPRAVAPGLRAALQHVSAQ